MDRLKDAMLAWPVGTRVACGVSVDMPGGEAPLGTVAGHDEDRIGVYVEVRYDRPKATKLSAKWHPSHLHHLEAGR